MTWSSTRARMFRPGRSSRQTTRTSHASRYWKRSATISKQHCATPERVVEFSCDRNLGRESQRVAALDKCLYIFSVNFAQGNGRELDHRLVLQKILDIGLPSGTPIRSLASKPVRHQLDEHRLQFRIRPDFAEETVFRKAVVQ